MPNPTMERIRAEYIEMRAENFGFADLYAEEFDRCLNEERAKAWAHGYADGQDSVYLSGSEWPVNTTNPHRKAEQ